MEGSKDDKTLLRVEGLKKYFTKSSGIIKRKTDYIKAVDDVSFYINRGETFGLVGESGCGKSTTGRTIIRLYQPTAGKIIYEGKDIAALAEKELGEFRHKMQMIFQDPYASLNGRMTVLDIVGEPLDVQKKLRGKEREEKILSLLQAVGMNQDHASRYPHEFSGGQRQRIGIARALAAEPEFIICDEPISALDVSIQAQVVNMLEDLQAELGLTYLFIAHDLSMVRHISDRIGVMYLGSIVETAKTDELYDNPAHPYTQALLSSVPVPDPELNKATHRIYLEGDIPTPLNPPSGCKFRTRCRYASKRCAEDAPEMREISPEHFAACHLLK